jgi:hypothetical protein
MNGNVKNEWFATKPEEFEIMNEAGINRVKHMNKKDKENNKIDHSNDDDVVSGEESDGKIKSKNNKVNKNIPKSNIKKRKDNTFSDSEQSKSNDESSANKNSNKKKKSIVEKNVIQNKSDSPLVDDNNNNLSDNEEDYWNTTVKVVESETYVQFSPGQNTVGNDSLLDGYTIASPGMFF